MPLAEDVEGKVEYWLGKPKSQVADEMSLVKVLYPSFRRQKVGSSPADLLDF